MNRQFGHDRDPRCARMQSKDVFYKKSIYRLLFNLDQDIFVVMANPGALPEAGSRSVVANYVATLTAELATMARRSGRPAACARAPAKA